MELVAKAFSASEMNLPTAISSGEQKACLIKDYNKQLQEYGLIDLLKVPVSERTNNMYDWRRINLAYIFSYILKTRDFQRDYVGRYKDEKDYYYFDSGFVDEILLHIEDVAIKIVYCKVKTSMRNSNFKELWVGIQDNGKILTCWCTCMAGTSQCCNHVIACLI